MKHVKLYEAFKKKPKNNKIQLDLNGEQGNAFYVIGLAKNLAKQIGWSPEEISSLQSDMMSSDYTNLIRIFEDKFGDFVDIYGFEGYIESEDLEDEED